jgi:hypothetical protein
MGATAKKTMRSIQNHQFEAKNVDIWQACQYHRARIDTTVPVLVDFWPFLAYF